jgi:hypothetical protein
LLIITAFLNIIEQGKQIFMKRDCLNVFQPQDAWVLHREDIYIAEEVCNAYVLLDAYSCYCFAQELSVDIISKVTIINMITNAINQAQGELPKQFLIAKNDPLLATLKQIGLEFKMKVQDLPAKEIKELIRPFSDAFIKFTTGNDNAQLSTLERDELEAFIPATYGPCPCASGKQFKFCCQKAFRDITFAMCAAEDGDLEEALHFMKQAELKLGMTAEILCRYAICWSFFDQKKYSYYLQETIKINPNHPRLNYILGVDAKLRKQYAESIKFYQKAIDHYPPEDKFHLNETYNNMGTAYLELKKYEEAKAVWEKALVLLPTDQMVKENLVEFIYENPLLPENIREISPFMTKYLNKY